MRDGIILNQQEVKEIIAEKFGVDVEDVIRSKYSYIVITSEEQETRYG